MHKIQEALDEVKALRASVNKLVAEVKRLREGHGPEEQAKIDELFTEANGARNDADAVFTEGNPAPLPSA